MNREEMKQVRELAKSMQAVSEKLIELASPKCDKPEPEEVSQPKQPAPLPDSGFRMSRKSRRELQGVAPELIACTELAMLNFTTQDFIVFDGLRTEEEQREYVRRGVSRTMNSKHLVGLAVDLVPLIDGVPQWDWEGCARIAYAMDQAATHLGIADRIVWGGVWDRTLADYGGSPESYMRQVQAYQSRKGGRAFVDGPHFELRA